MNCIKSEIRFVGIVLVRSTLICFHIRINHSLFDFYHGIKSGLEIGAIVTYIEGTNITSQFHET